jgi:hypothetical protein
MCMGPARRACRGDEAASAVVSKLVRTGISPRRERWSETSDPVSCWGRLCAAFFGGKPRRGSRLRHTPSLVSL